MAIVTILLSCALGAVVGLFQLVFLGASFGQAFLTYLAVSAVLSATMIGVAMVMAHVNGAEADDTDLTRDNTETRQDWQAEKAMASDRCLISERTVKDELVTTKLSVRHTA